MSKRFSYPLNPKTYVAKPVIHRNNIHDTGKSKPVITVRRRLRGLVKMILSAKNTKHYNDLIRSKSPHLYLAKDDYECL
jgi:hypothetical protein